ncbi:hypothetical protein [Streptomyces misionensis]|uniref:hypothetical protein n=1 Tax=Streptomyces misionensis TaxID=67331 RepID=UPI0036C398CE
MTKPGRSALLMAMDERASWSETDYLLARMSDALELSNFLFIKAHAEDTDGLDLPTPVTRPGQPEPQPEPQQHFASGQEVVDFFGRMNSL